MASSAVPVLLIGKTSTIGDLVKANLEPEYKVMRFFRSYEEMKDVIPVMLADPSAPDAPRAVLAGGGFASPEVVQARELPNALNVPWLHYATPRDAATAFKMPTGDPAFIGKAIATAQKATLKENGIVAGAPVGRGKGELWKYTPVY